MHNLFRKILLWVFAVSFGAHTFAQSIQNTGSKTMIIRNYGGAQEDSTQRLPRVKAIYPKADSSGRICFDSINSKHIWYHDGAVWVELVPKEYVDSAVASEGGGGGSGTVTSVSSSNNSLTVTNPTTNASVVINTAHANTWSSKQTFNSGYLVLKGFLGGSVTFSASDSSVSDVSLKLPPVQGSAGQILVKGDNDNLLWRDQSGGGSGVSSFNGRTGAVDPEPGDYGYTDIGGIEDAVGDTASDIRDWVQTGLDDTAADIRSAIPDRLDGKGFVKADGTTISYDNSTYLTTAVTSVTAGTGLSGGTITGTGTISMPNTGTAGTYGDATHIPGITTDAQGRVTGVSVYTFTAGSTGVNSIVATAPLVAMGASIVTLTMPKASASQAGYLGALDYQAFAAGNGTVTSLQVVSNAAAFSVTPTSATTTSAVYSIVPTGTSSQFVKADGSKDGTTYLTGLTGPITSTGNATGIAAQTGTGTTFVVQVSPTVTGTPAAPTAANGTNTTQIATTGFTQTAITITSINTTPLIPGGNITLAGGGSGTVTSVGATVPSNMSVSGSPVTTSGTFAITYKGLYTITDGANFVFDGSNSSMQAITLGASRTFTITNLLVGVTYRFIVNQDGTGSRVLTWGTTVKAAWGYSGTPPISTTASAQDVYEIWTDGTTVHAKVDLNWN